MHFKPNRKLIAEKLLQQAKPDQVGTLKRADCEIGNLLECVDLPEEWQDIFKDLHRQVRAAI